ncbi:hypothetical protein H4Q26_011193 [Puccinia striiformis f. sp. tritici PST-130]|nr:hypothetical protein H4Q26_011193 [Puccinia striiformis f. sp. tritici PST-130]
MAYNVSESNEMFQAIEERGKLRELWRRLWEPITRLFSVHGQGEWPTTLAKSNEMFQAIEERGKAQRALAASLGTDYAALRGSAKAKGAIVTTDAGNRLGTRLKEKIMGAINRRKNPVERAIKLFNERQRAYLQKVDASRLLLPENQDLTLAEFRAMDLTDPLWNDNHFYHARAPWALDPNVRRGIKSVLFLDRVEETIRHIDLEAEEPVNPDNEFAAILPSFPSMKGKLRLLRSELVRHLEEHQRLMVTWSTDEEEEEDEDEDGSLTGDDDINMEVIDDHVDGPGGPTE